MDANGKRKLRNSKTGIDRPTDQKWILELIRNHLLDLLRIAELYEIPVVATSKVLKEEGFFKSELIDDTYLVTATRVVLRPAHSGVHIARLASSPYLPPGEEIFRIRESGIEDVEVSDSENG